MVILQGTWLCYWKRNKNIDFHNRENCVIFHPCRLVDPAVDNLRQSIGVSISSGRLRPGHRRHTTGPLQRIPEESAIQSLWQVLRRVSDEFRAFLILGSTKIPTFLVRFLDGPAVCWPQSSWNARWSRSRPPRRLWTIPTCRWTNGAKGSWTGRPCWRRWPTTGIWKTVCDDDAQRVLRLGGGAADPEFGNRGSAIFERRDTGLLLRSCVRRAEDRRWTDGPAIRATERRVSGGQRRGVRRVRRNGRAARGGQQERARRPSAAGRTRVRFGASPGVLAHALHRVFRQVGNICDQLGKVKHLKVGLRVNFFHKFFTRLVTKLKKL